MGNHISIQTGVREYDEDTFKYVGGVIGGLTPELPASESKD